MAVKASSELWNHYNNIVEEGMAECKLCKQRLRNNRSYNLKLHLKKVHHNRGEVNKYFNVHAEENRAECKTCGQSLKNRLCNLRLHMRRFHNIEIKLPEEKPQEQPPSPEPYDEDQIQAVLKVAKRKMYEQRHSKDKRPKRRLLIKMDKITITRCVMGLIVEDGLSPHMFDSKHIKAVLKPMCEAISDKEGRDFKIDRPDIENIITLMANYIRKDFSNDLHSRLLSIKIDSDLKAAANSYCLSAQYINDGEIETRVLGLIDLGENESHLNEEHIKHILYKFNIDSNQIISAVWDNTKGKYNLTVKNSEFLNEIELYESFPEIYVGDVKVERYFSDSAQLCLMGIFKNSNIYQPFMECRNLVQFLNEASNGYQQIFNQNNLNIPELDSPWKLGSTYQMMQNLLEARQVLKDIKFEKMDNQEDQFNNSNELWSFIEAFCNSTTYLQKSILKYYNEKLHIGDFYAQWLKCKLLTEKLKANNKQENVYETLILSEVLKVIEKRTNELLNEERFVACIYLDPRFQRTLNKEGKTKAAEYLKMLWSRSKLYIEDDTIPVDVTSLAMEEDDEDNFLNEFLSHDVEEKDIKTNDIYRKIDELKLTFQMADTNVVQFWRCRKMTEPELNSLSTICFAIPATEKYHKPFYFHIYRLDDNSKLLPFIRENLMYIRLNAHLLDEALGHLNLYKKNKTTSSDADDDFFDTSEDNSNSASIFSSAPSTSKAV